MGYSGLREFSGKVVGLKLRDQNVLSGSYVLLRGS
jgi:hypothetical protein